jgi:uncharacterized membrane protein YjjP (DUF1212 family)
MTLLSESLIIETRSLDEIPHAPKRDEPVGFLLRLAKALHTYGLPAYELEQTMNGCAEALGYGIQCMSLPTSISMTLLPPDSPAQTFLIRVAPGEVNLEKLRLTTKVAQHVIANHLTCVEGAARLKTISDKQSPYHGWVIVFAFALVSGSIARIFSGGLWEVGSAGLIGFLVGGLALASRTRPLLNHLLPAVCAFLATLLAIFINDLVEPHIAISVVIISGLVILLPGLGLTIAMAELATANLVSGTARLTGAATIFIQLAFGSALGVELSKFYVTDFHGVCGVSGARWQLPLLPWCHYLKRANGTLSGFSPRRYSHLPQSFLPPNYSAIHSALFVVPLLWACLPN